MPRLPKGRSGGGEKKDGKDRENLIMKKESRFLSYMGLSLHDLLLPKDPAPVLIAASVFFLVIHPHDANRNPIRAGPTIPPL